ncbi:MAG: hypothetical protein IT362_02610 [Deltaproteobacteria bacterium]|nr:hypothetical protein [Deltaproteobacteria bacterium]
MNDNRAKGAGFISIRALFWLLFLASCFYAAYKFIPPYASFYMLKTEVEEEAKTSHMYTDAALANRITTKAAVWSIPLGPDKLVIARGTDQITITVDYTVDLDFFDRYHKELVYHIEVRQPLKERGRILQ